MEFWKLGDKGAIVADKKLSNEKGYQNKWNWKWLEEVDHHKRPWSLWLKKPKERGFAFCTLCNTKIRYLSSGKKGIRQHSNLAKHVSAVNNQTLTQTLPGAESRGAPMSMEDRKIELKAVTCAFLAENSLPLSLSQELLDYAKRMNQDTKALKISTMSRFSATYLSTNGLAEAFREETQNTLCGSFVSINIDESTNENNDKMLNVVIRFFNEELKEVSTQHIGSRKVNQATSANIVAAVHDVLKANNIEPDQIISALMDNCNTMRGKKNGVEKQLRDGNKNLLDIGGDTVHIVNNAAKAFCSPFSGYLEDFCGLLYYDLCESPKAKDIFQIQSLLGLRPKVVIRPVSSRFLQMLTVCERYLEVQDAVFLYYSSFLSHSEHTSEIDGVMSDIFEKHNVSQEVIGQIKNLLGDVHKTAKGTREGNSRKDTLISEVITHREKLLLHMEMYTGILPLFQKFLKAIQAEKPMCHVLHGKMFSLIVDFMSYFVKASDLEEIKTPKDLSAFSLTDKEKQVGDKRLALGPKAYTRMKKLRVKKQEQHWLQEFWTTLRNAYRQGALYIIKNLPRENVVLASLSALDPELRKQETTEAAFLLLAQKLPNVLSPDECGQLSMELKRYSTDKDLDVLFQTVKDVKQLRIDWWRHVFALSDVDADSGSETERFPVLHKLTAALLSVFTAPLVEGTFNIMDDVVRADRSSLTPENYEGITYIRSYLRSRKIKSSEMRMNAAMRKKCAHAFSSYSEMLQKKKAAGGCISSTTSSTTTETAGKASSSSATTGTAGRASSSSSATTGTAGRASLSSSATTRTAGRASSSSSATTLCGSTPAYSGCSNLNDSSCPPPLKKKCKVDIRNFFQKQ